MGTSKRTDQNGSEAPGPGQYDQGAPKDGPAYAFGGAQREQIRDSGIPGPGQYSQQGMIGKDSQGRTMGMKLQEKDRDYVPGPGQYEMRHTVG